MNLTAPYNLIYLGTQKRTSRNTGNDFEIITLADPNAYQTYDFMKNDDIEIPFDLKEQDKVTAILTLGKRGFRNELGLKSLEKAK